MPVMCHRFIYNRLLPLASTQNWSRDALESDKSMLTRASKAKQDWTNSIGMRPSSVVLQLFVRACIFSAFCICMRAHAILRGNMNDVKIGITTHVVTVAVDCSLTFFCALFFRHCLPSWFLALSQSPIFCHISFHGKGAWEIVIDWHILLTEEIKWCETSSLLLPPSLNSLTCLNRVHLCGA